jgi:uncharacterized protein YecE (DUF72 family)
VQKRAIRVGCAGWSVPKEHAARFAEDGSHLTRYASRLSAVEVNSSFYRPHRLSTYARWAAETPDDFAFSLKVPKTITHEHRLADASEALERFLAETAALGSKRGPLLVQLPPSLSFDARVVGAFLSELRRRYEGDVACEPRHATWFTSDAERLLSEQHVARVAADPAVVPTAAKPGAWGGLVYYRLHGSPQMYASPYSTEYLEHVSTKLAEAATSAPTWCIFDNTALGAATADALALLERLHIIDGAPG